MEIDLLVVPLEMETGPDSVTGKATEAAVAVEDPQTVVSAERKVEHLENTDPSFGVDEVVSVVEVEDLAAVPQVPLQSRVLRFYYSCSFFIQSLQKKKHWIGYWITRILVVLNGTERQCYAAVWLILMRLNDEKAPCGSSFTFLITDALRWLYSFVSHDVPIGFVIPF